jgi:Meckelin (Transmembrane protein 67)
VKRFFIIDTTSGRQFTSDGKNTNSDEAKFYDRFTQINYVKSIELRFHILDDENVDEVNKINIPLMVIEYGTLNLTNFSSSIKSSFADAYNVDFTFKIKFVKRPNLNFFFQIILPILILLAFFYALMQTFFYKVRQQKIEYDFAILFNFTINFLANISNAFFAFILAFSCYVFFIYKSQSSVIKITLPLEREEEAIEIMLAIALVFKVKSMNFKIGFC